MSRTYNVVMQNVTVTSTNTLVALASGTNAPALEMLRAWSSQSGSVTSAQTKIRLVTQFNTAAANQVVGTAATPAPTALQDPVSKIIGSSVAGPGGVATVNCTSDGNGVKTTLYEDNFNVLNGWLWVPTPADTHVLSNASSSQSYGLAFPIAPSSLSNQSAGVTYREIG